MEIQFDFKDIVFFKTPVALKFRTLIVKRVMSSDDKSEPVLFLSKPSADAGVPVGETQTREMNADDYDNDESGMICVYLNHHKNLCSVFNRRRRMAFIFPYQ